MLSEEPTQVNSVSRVGTLSAPGSANGIDGHAARPEHRTRSNQPKGLHMLQNLQGLDEKLRELILGEYGSLPGSVTLALFLSGRNDPTPLRLLPRGVVISGSVPSGPTTFRVKPKYHQTTHPV